MKASRALLVASALFFVTACGDLLKKKGAGDAGGEAGATAEPAASGAPSATAAAAPSDAPSAAVDVAPAELKLPGACIDAFADAKKRAPNHDATVDDSLDIDGDGKKDRIYSTSFQMHIWAWVYVMRGTCGYFVGETGPTDGWKVSANKSGGLRSFELTFQDACTDDCGCVTRTAPLYFTGAKYTQGKVKETVAKPCDAGAKVPAPSKDAGAAVAGPYKAGDKVNVEWKGQVYGATIMSVGGPDKIKVHYDGYEAKWDEVVTASRIRGRR
jgi:hypothetical protein